MLTRRTFLKTMLVGAVGLTGLAAYPFVEVLARPRVTRYSLKPPGWTDGLKLRICALADFHACEPWMNLSRIKSICEKANSLEADIILLLGDYAAGTRLVSDYVNSADWSRALASLQAPLGVHAILGNHDYWEDLAFQKDQRSENIAASALRKAGIATYINDSVRLEKDGRPFWIAGLGDQLALLPGSGSGRSSVVGIDDLRGTLSQVTDEAPVLLMAHEPDIFPSVPDRVSLTLCGHTHGGQVNIFGWRPAAASAGSRRYPLGHYREENRDMIVSKGLGCSILPVRIGAWPEILLIELG
ncbi:metallophosphoesterase [Hoeflea ulvae]|uniref:Metallophosphoesterase n=1 Tax=Hoeflea ulvae TaxID=2983764 RepID=A0ABT3YKM9_9HYPH|nr:metallophosphoesterase [Hoeflea ulvae]MCY0096461.1 metallophosphoesterase [Hoeflea ulvae]